MNQKQKIMAAVVGLALLLPIGAQAQDSSAQDEDALALSAGVYDVADENTTAEFRVQYNWGAPLFWEIKPHAGVLATVDGGVYGYGGVRYDADLSQNWMLQPSFSAGLYGDGDGKDLGHTVEFKSELGLYYKFTGGHNLGVAVSHISNASLGDSNPGTESVVLTYTIPVNRFIGR